jgi:hypothetical protein
MVVDEAHFIKNKASQRSQHVLALSDRIRSRTDRPLLMALTGTPLINDIEDFLAIWQFLGWIDESKPLGELADALEATGLTPADRGFYPAARQCVIDLGVVRRRKLDVAADIPARRGRAGRSGRQSGTWPTGWWRGTRPRSRTGPATPGSRASTTTSSGGWPGRS